MKNLWPGGTSSGSWRRQSSSDWPSVFLPVLMRGWVKPCCLGDHTSPLSFVVDASCCSTSGLQVDAAGVPGPTPDGTLRPPRKVFRDLL